MRRCKTASLEELTPMKIKIRMKMKKIAMSLAMLSLCASSAFAANDEKEKDRVEDAGVVLKEILNIPDDIPQDLLDKAECVVIVTDHSCFDYRGLAEKALLIVDTRNALMGVISKKIVRL